MQAFPLRGGALIMALFVVAPNGEKEHGIRMNASDSKLGLIAGNGRFPFVLLDAARAHGLSVVVAAIREETDPEIDARAAADPAIRVHWLSLGELSRLIDTFRPKASPGPSWPARSGTPRSSPPSAPTGVSPSCSSTCARATPTCCSAPSPRCSPTRASSWSPRPSTSNRCSPSPASSPSAPPPKTSARTSPTDAPLPAASPPSTSARPSSSPPRPASPSKPWRAPTPPSSAPAH